MNVCLNTCFACIGHAIRAALILTVAPRRVHGIHAVCAQRLPLVQLAAAWLSIPPAKRQAMVLAEVTR